MAKVPLDAQQMELAVKTARALQAASAAVLKDEKHASDEIQRQFYAKVKPELILSALDTLSPGVKGNGAMSESGIVELLKFATESGEPLSKTLDPKPGPHAFWTNHMVEAASR